MNLVDLTRVVICAACIAAAPAMGQSTPLPQPPTGAAPSASTTATLEAAPPAADKPPFKPEELEQMLAPVALYPDSLLSQVFMASTYPIEIVEADRWAKANASLKGDALTKELEKKSWDASVRSLVNFPQVLAMMSENISTTVKIGDAFIGQQKEVMDTVQKLRAKAQAQGNLKTSKEQSVKTENVEGGTQVIVIESTSPEVIYVPQYNPTVVYGSWPYPAYPPYPYYPPNYYPVATPLLSFGVGVACGAAWGYAMGNCNWGHGDVDIDVNRNTNINNNIDRSKFKNASTGDRGKGSWKHDPSHRQGAAYRNNATAQKVGAGNASARTSQAQSQYRGKAEAGRSDIARGGADSFKGASPSARPGGGAGGARAPSAGTSDRGAFSGAGQSGAAARDSSNRGSASRSASPSASRSTPSRSSSGGSRGGGSRGGGGRGGGGRR